MVEGMKPKTVLYGSETQVKSAKERKRREVLDTILMRGPSGEHAMDRVSYEVLGGNCGFRRGLL